MAPESKERALDDAYETFVGAKISAHSESTWRWDGVSNIFVMGRPLIPEEATENLPSVQIAVLHSQTLQSLSRKQALVCPCRLQDKGQNPIQHRRVQRHLREDLGKNLKPYQDSSHIVMLATCNMVGWAVPTTNLALFLQSCGAGKQLAEWQGFAKATTFMGSINYALIGYIGTGPGQGFEHVEFSKAVFSHESDRTDPITITARLVPLRANKSVQFRPIGGGREQVTMLEL